MIPGAAARKANAAPTLSNKSQFISHQTTVSTALLLTSTGPGFNFTNLRAAARGTATCLVLPRLTPSGGAFGHFSEQSGYAASRCILIRFLSHIIQ